VAFAATAAHEMVRGEGLDLSEEFLHWGAKQRDNLPGDVEATYLWAAAGVLATLGQPLEEVWPYAETRDQTAPDYAPPDGALEAAQLRQLAPGAALSANAAAVRDALDNGQVVILAITLFITMYTARPDGVIAMPKTGDYAAGGHAVLVVGYQDGEGDGGGRFIIRNSWGESWAIGGYGLLPYAYVDDHGQDAWVFADPSRQVAGGEP
jgi:hypothetical protein